VGVSESDVPESYLSGNIVYRGMVSHADALEQMRSSDVMLFTSLHEGTPHAVLESLHLGVPVMCHDAWGQGDVVTKNCGTKIPFESPDVSVSGFVSAIKALLEDQNRLSELSKGALDRAREITWSKRAEQVVGVYRQVLDSD
jgi:teichuronic acid biosynthesis glycosyltransferase TuaC